MNPSIIAYTCFIDFHIKYPKVRLRHNATKRMCCSARRLLGCSL